MDGNFSLWSYGDNLADLHWCGKFRGPDFAKITFRLNTVYSMDLVDTKGRPLPTVRASVVTEAEAAADAQAAIASEDRLLIAINKRPGATLEQWAADCRLFVKGDQMKPNKPAAGRIMDRLRQSKLVDKHGRTFVLTKSGKAALEKITEGSTA